MGVERLSGTMLSRPHVGQRITNIILSRASESSELVFLCDRTWDIRIGVDSGSNGKKPHDNFDKKPFFRLSLGGLRVALILDLDPPILELEYRLPTVGAMVAYLGRVDDHPLSLFGFGFIGLRGNLLFLVL